MFLLTIYLPWLLNMLPYSYWALTCLAVLPTYSAFMISVRQASDLPPASFRFPVTQDTLALGYILPAVGRIGDFHPLKHAPAGRTKKTGSLCTLRKLPVCYSFPILSSSQSPPLHSGTAHMLQYPRFSSVRFFADRRYTERSCSKSDTGSCTPSKAAKAHPDQSYPPA